MYIVAGSVLKQPLCCCVTRGLLSHTVAWSFAVGCFRLLAVRRLILLFGNENGYTSTTPNMASMRSSNANIHIAMHWESCNFFCNLLKENKKVMMHVDKKKMMSCKMLKNKPTLFQCFVPLTRNKHWIIYTNYLKRFVFKFYCSKLVKVFNKFQYMQFYDYKVY